MFFSCQNTVYDVFWRKICFSDCCLIIVPEAVTLLAAWLRIILVSREPCFVLFFSEKSCSVKHFSILACCSCFNAAIMEKKRSQNNTQLLPVLICCLMLACSGIVFGVYTYRQISWLKIQILQHQKVIETLQSGNGDGNNQVWTIRFSSASVRDSFKPFYAQKIALIRETSF